MPDDRTTITELGTALGMLGNPDIKSAVASRPRELDLEPPVWEHVEMLVNSGRYERELSLAWSNGSHFLGAPDALRHRPPRLIEWTGGRRPPGDEVAPVDLRVDHVYLVSCKYLSRNIANPSPGRLFDGLLATTGSWGRGDWYSEVAPREYLALYKACVAMTESPGRFPRHPDELSPTQRRALRDFLRSRVLPSPAAGHYAELCVAVSEASARRWRANLSHDSQSQLLVWRLLRIGNAPYFLLGADSNGPLRLRVASPWDWRRWFKLEDISISPAVAGQPKVDWRIFYHDRRSSTSKVASGHVEIRWSHGRFAQPPEAKVYLETPVYDLPGYFALGDADSCDPDLDHAPRTPEEETGQIRLFE